jgi:SAM-dependent methyltransferase
MSTAQQNYDARILKEIDIFSGQTDVHDLPEIFHYWSNRYVRPKLEPFGFSSPQGMFKLYLQRQCEREPGGRGPHGLLRFISIGAGNCDLEIELARHLKSQGHTRFVIDCLDLNGAMLKRGREEATQKGVEDQIGFVQGDFNEWEPAQEYDAVLASHALHHVVNLEGLFQQVKKALAPHGQFIVSDMIGRNGHQRWPEALEIVQELWQELPEAYRYNRMLRRQEDTFLDWDCSQQSFEGIRSQDILPLLLNHFHFELFVPYGNVIDPFVDRAFGHHFDASAAWDRAFIDRVHQRDEEAMLAGRIKPVHMEAVLRKDFSESILCERPFTPEFSVRWPDTHLIVQELQNRIAKLDDEKADLEQSNAALSQEKAELEQAKSDLEHSKAALQRDKAEIERHAATLELQVQMAADSRWVRAGNKLGVGPRFR